MAHVVRYGHIVYSFDEANQKDYWSIQYDDDPINVHIDLDFMAKLSPEIGVWISIEGVSGKLKMKFMSEEEYCNSVENHEIIEDLATNLRFNLFYTYGGLLNEQPTDISDEDPRYDHV